MSSNVTLEIAGRRYTIACAAGEEQHIEKLGAGIDSKLKSLDNLQGQSAERTLLYASLLLADELHEAKNGGGTGARPQDDDAHAQMLEKMADRLETLASQLESAP
ncbi:cell division protein ZapA [Aurantiacibacter gangjinensis]|uniref:Uncharacterized protein n=1 Tax=Aurantiacibacter gangjinensis TaxID=502682 RepID=A0A0G9MQC4_9SPHN|nr:cell division protein ZapA [Aurantiacibacter gangjinensis]APE28579.1 hypothetical protein BMF35_a1750 [Aurantiacibacter gangjinensis]KLE32769.1 hypothetical protein AAW01_01640 [Aurantiacibacter gangjinensis]